MLEELRLALCVILIRSVIWVVPKNNEEGRCMLKHIKQLGLDLNAIYELKGE